VKAADASTKADQRRERTTSPPTAHRQWRTTRLIEAVERGIDAAGKALTRTNDLDGGW
jgi:hypothetical protein